MAEAAASSIHETPLRRRVKIVEQGAGVPVVFLHSGVGSAGEWKQVFALWPDGYRLLAVDAYGGGSGPGRDLDDYADQVYAAAAHAGEPVHLVGFSWGGATALRVATAAPQIVRTVTVIEPEAYGLLRTESPGAYAELCDLRDGWRAHVRDGRWADAFAAFIDFYNGPGSFGRWPEERRDAFLAVQQTRGDLWDVLFDERLLDADALARVRAPAHLVEGSATSTVDRAMCEAIRRHLPPARHTVIDGAAHMIPLTHPGPLTRALLAGIDEG